MVLIARKIAVFFIIKLLNFFCFVGWVVCIFLGGWEWCGVLTFTFQVMVLVFRSLELGIEELDVWKDFFGRGVSSSRGPSGLDVESNGMSGLLWGGLLKAFGFNAFLDGALAFCMGSDSPNILVLLRLR